MGESPTVASDPPALRWQLYSTLKKTVFGNGLTYTAVRLLRPGKIRNEFIYAACGSSKMSLPDIPVMAAEHYGQCAEDIIVRSLLLALGARRRVDLREMLYIEIGANHPFATSASYLLSRTLGMTGILVEANEKLLDDLKRGRPKDTILYGAVQDQDIDHVMFSISTLSEISSLDRSFVLSWDEGRTAERAWKEVPALRITDIFRNHTKGKDVAYLSIDVEGMDLALLQDMDFVTYRPWVVQAEPSDGYKPGNSDAITNFMASVGYKLAAITTVNLIFTDEQISQI